MLYWRRREWCGNDFRVLNRSWNWGTGGQTGRTGLGCEYSLVRSTEQASTEQWKALFLQNLPAGFFYYPQRICIVLHTNLLHDNELLCSIVLIQRVSDSGIRYCLHSYACFLPDLGHRSSLWVDNQLPNSLFDRLEDQWTDSKELPILDHAESLLVSGHLLNYMDFWRENLQGISNYFFHIFTSNWAVERLH